MYNQVPYITLFIKINQKMKQLKSIAIICFYGPVSLVSQISSDKSSASLNHLSWNLRSSNRQNTPRTITLRNHHRRK